MVAHSQSIFSNEVTLDRIAEHWVRKTEYMLSKGIEFRNANPGQQFTDVFYEKLVATPMDALTAIYRDRESISPELHQRFMITEQQNSQHKYGTHNYHLEDFGLSKEEIDKKMKFYSAFLKTLTN